MAEHGKAAAAREWRISAGGTEVTVRLDNGTLYWKTESPGPGMSFGISALGRLTIGGKKLLWDRVLEAGSEPDNEGNPVLTVIVENQEYCLQLKRMITVYGDHPFIRTWGFLTNTGDRESVIDGCEILSIQPAAKLPLALFHVEQFSSEYRHDFFRPNEVRLLNERGTYEIKMGSYPALYWEPTSCAWFALLEDRLLGWYNASPEKGDGLVGGIEFNGKSRLHAWAEGGQGKLVSRIDELEYELHPGGCFEIPAVFLGRFQGDWDEAGYVTQQFSEKYVYPAADKKYPWVQYNSWAYGKDINERQQMEAIERCAQLGIELVVLDLGWSRRIGDWHADPVKFPHGLRPLAEKAKACGMRFGVHAAFAQCDPEAPVAIEHPEWLIRTDNEYFGAAPLCLGHAPCREWVINELSALIDEEGLDYIVQDGEDMVKTCRRTDHTHGANDSNYSNSQYGLDMVIDSLRKRHPGLVVENCEDGGCMMTFKMARLYHTSITVDNMDAYSTRQGIYGVSYPFSLRYSARYLQDEPNKYTLYSSIFGGPLIFMHCITNWDEKQMNTAKQAINLYKALRKQLQGAKVIHLEAPRNNIPQGGWGWDAIQAVSADRRNSVVMIYRAGGDVSRKCFYPRGLKEDCLYHVRSYENDYSRTYTGEEIEKNGIPVEMGEFDAKIIMIEGGSADRHNVPDEF